MNEELLNKIQKRIEADNIQPLPRWRFILLRTSFWLLAILSVIVGSFAVGTILFLFSDYSRHNLPPIPRDISEVLLMIPYLWIILFLFFIAVAQISIEHTKKGYQYKIHTVIVSSVLLSIIFGSILNYIGASRATHKSLHQYTIYNSVIYDSRDAYSRPKFGRLAGTITRLKMPIIFQYLCEVCPAG